MGHSLYRESLRRKSGAREPDALESQPAVRADQTRGAREQDALEPPPAVRADQMH